MISHRAPCHALESMKSEGIYLSAHPVDTELKWLPLLRCACRPPTGPRHVCLGRRRRNAALFNMDIYGGYVITPATLSRRGDKPVAYRMLETALSHDPAYPLFLHLPVETVAAQENAVAGLDGFGIAVGLCWRPHAHEADKPACRRMVYGGRFRQQALFHQLLSGVVIFGDLPDILLVFRQQIAAAVTEIGKQGTASYQPGTDKRRPIASF